MSEEEKISAKAWKNYTTASGKNEPLARVAHEKVASIASKIVMSPEKYCPAIDNNEYKYDVANRAGRILSALESETPPEIPRQEAQKALGELHHLAGQDTRFRDVQPHIEKMFKVLELGDIPPAPSLESIEEVTLKNVKEKNIRRA